MSKITLKLDESNDLNFQFRVQGTSSEAGGMAPQFRFVVAERDNPNSVGFVFAGSSREADGTITVTVPALNEMVKEACQYTGKVEVVVGSRILTPTILEVAFTRSLAVEVVPMMKEAFKVPTTPKPQQVSPEEIMFELETAPAAKPVSEAGSKQVTLTKTQLQEMIAARVAQKKMAASNPANSQMKVSLKDMMKSALED